MRRAALLGSLVAILAGTAGADEHVEALAIPGDPETGAETWEICAACHLPSGAGRPDGTFPQLAGQHRRVVIKQMADIRAGRRENPIMYPFAQSLIDARELADVAAYIETLPIPADNGKGPGDALDRGRELYARDCVACHGQQGEGDAEELHPVVAGQHYEYLLRQLREIAAERRRNAHPQMMAVVEAYTDADLAAVADYVSRLAWPERQAKPAPTKESPPL